MPLTLAAPPREGSEAPLGPLAEAFPFLTYSVAKDGGTTMTFVSREMSRRLGGEEHAFESALHPEDRTRVLAAHAAAVADRHDLATEYRLLGRDGRVLWVHDRGVPVVEETGATALTGYCVDITFHKETEEQLRASEGQFRAVVANIPGAVYRCECDSDWTIRFLSDDIEGIVGYPASDFIDNRVRRYGSLIHPEDRPGVRDRIEEAFKAGVPYSLEYRLVHADGRARWIAEHGRAIAGPSGEKQWLDGVILDIDRRKTAEHARRRAETELKTQSELNRYQALHDSLTGLGNRAFFHDRVERAVRSARDAGGEFALLLIDLDRFKEINDTLGHDAGDHLLQEVAKRLERVVRRVDSVTRLGGDEFACVLSGSSEATAEEVAGRIRRALYRPIVLAGLPLQIETSVGIAIYPHHGADGESLLKRADQAMYRAKKTSSGQTVYAPGEDVGAPERLTLASELRRAMTKRELCLHYQPKLDLRTGQVAGVEALLRWEHPVRGLVPPDDFIPVAQETALIGPLTRYVIDLALRQCRTWSRRGHCLSMAVNVSMRNVIDPGFPDDVSRLLRKWKVSPHLLELEITETALVADPFRSRPILSELSAMGIRLSIDDFGIGYTSLGYLKRLPVDELKIDRSFVSNLMSSDGDAAIVRSTIDLGRNLGLVVVGEGVESAEVLHRLRELGCDVAQGYHLSRPLPPGEALAWIESHTDPVPQPQRSGQIWIGDGPLTVQDVAQVALSGNTAALAPGAREQMESGRKVVERALSRGEVVYGLTAGVGPQKRVAVSAEDQRAFNRLMILAHCTGHGEPAPPEFVRAAMLVRGQGLALGAAGVRPAVVDAILAALNAGVTPVVHLLGSVGQSDLSPMAEIARALVGQGPDASLLERAGLSPLELAPREALALISANAFSVGIAALAVVRAMRAIGSLERSSALAYEGFGANVAAIDPAIAKLRPHRGIEETIRHVRALLEGGALAGGRRPARNLQDPLCFRVVPQTHASARQALAHLRELIETELRSGTDNPSVVIDEDRILATGNHDITPVAVALDYARLGLAQAITIANERIQKLLDPRFSGLPSGLRAGEDVFEDGLGALGHGATAVAAEARLLAAPVMLEQPSSSLAEGIEDRVTLAPVAARRLYEMSGLAVRLAAVESVCAAQALDLRDWQRDLGRGTTRVYSAVRESVCFTGRGEAPSDDLDAVATWLESEPPALGG